MEKQCKARKNPQIHLKKPFHRAFQNLKSFIFVGYKKLPKIPFLNPLRQNNEHKRRELDELFKGFSENWKSNLEQSRNKKNDVSNSEENPQICRRKTEEKAEKKKKKQQQETKGNGNKLAMKMKEYEMLEAEDVDHLLDIEEVLDSYSRLTSPIYVEMVDEFFMDMYSEFSVPKPSVVSVSRNNSMRRHGSCNSSMRIVESCNTSMRRLAPLKLYKCENSNGSKDGAMI